MDSNIIIAIIGALSTIVTHVITSRSKEKEKQNALDSLKKNHEHELEILKMSHSHDLTTREKEIELEIAKLQAEAESAKDLEQNTLINDMMSPLFQAHLSDPESELSKVINHKFKEAAKQTSNNFVRNK